MTPEEKRLEIARLWELGKPRGRSDNPEVIAGQYLDWKGGRVEEALHALYIHRSGEYIDMPPFPGCADAIAILEKLVEDK